MAYNLKFAGFSRTINLQKVVSTSKFKTLFFFNLQVGCFRTYPRAATRRVGIHLRTSRAPIQNVFSGYSSIFWNTFIILTLSVLSFQSFLSSPITSLMHFMWSSRSLLVNKLTVGTSSKALRKYSSSTAPAWPVK